MWVWIGCWNRKPWNSSMILMAKNYIYITIYTHYTTQNVTERVLVSGQRNTRALKKMDKHFKGFDGFIAKFTQIIIITPKIIPQLLTPPSKNLVELIFQNAF